MVLFSSYILALFKLKKIFLIAKTWINFGWKNKPKTQDIYDPFLPWSSLPLIVIIYYHKAEDIKKRWQKYTEELYKKDLHDQGNHDGVITDLEPDILECEVKWALESITMNKASGGDGIPVELFKILKDDAVKVLHSICQQIWKTQRGHRTGKGQFSFQSQRKVVPKKAQTTAQLHSSHTLVK